MCSEDSHHGSFKMLRKYVWSETSQLAVWCMWSRFWVIDLGLYVLWLVRVSSPTQPKVIIPGTQILQRKELSILIFVFHLFCCSFLSIIVLWFFLWTFKWMGLILILTYWNLKAFPISIKLLAWVITCRISCECKAIFCDFGPEQQPKPVLQISFVAFFDIFKIMRLWSLKASFTFILNSNFDNISFKSIYYSAATEQTIFWFFKWECHGHWNLHQCLQGSMGRDGK